MSRAPLIIGLLLFALSLPAGQSQPRRTTTQPPAEICGQWLVKSLLPTTNVQTSPAHLKSYLGLKAVYTSFEMKFGSESISHPRYSVRALSAAQFFRGSYIPLAQIGIKKNSVIDIEVWDSAGGEVIRPGTELFAKNRNQIVTTWDGGYFLLVRTGGCF